MNQDLRDNRDDVVEIDLVELFGVILHNLWIIIVSGVIVGSIALLASKFLLTPKFESVTKIYIISKSNSESVTYTDLQVGSTLTKDYRELVKSRPVLDEVITETGIETEAAALANQIDVEVPQDTRIVSITVTDEDPYMARDIANSVRIAAAKHIQNVMDTEAVNVVEEANLPTSKSSPNVMKNTAIGYIAGIVLAMAIIIIIYIMDDTIKTPDDVEKFLGVSVLGTIPYSESDLSDRDEMEEYERKRKAKKKKKKQAEKEQRVYRTEDRSNGDRSTENRRIQDKARQTSATTTNNSSNDIGENGNKSINSNIKLEEINLEESNG